MILKGVVFMKNEGYRVWVPTRFDKEEESIPKFKAPVNRKKTSLFNKGHVKITAIRAYKNASIDIVDVLFDNNLNNPVRFSKQKGNKNADYRSSSGKTIADYMYPVVVGDTILSERVEFVDEFQEWKKKDDVTRRI